jgi:hypothetical protein
MKLRIALIAGTVVALPTASSAAALEEATYQTSGVMWHAFQEPLGNTGEVADAGASLTRTANGVSFQLHTNSLTRGNAYTLWFAVVDNPSACSTLPCPPPEVTGNPETDGQVTWAGGLVAGDTAGTFAGEVEVGPLEGWLPDRSFDNPDTAHVHLIVHDHGPVAPELLPGMINTFRGGCTDESLPPVPESALADGEPGPNTCTFFQVAVFQET